MFGTVATTLTSFSSSQVVGCLCPNGFSGKFCGNISDICQGKPCFRGVKCQPKSEAGQFTCGECPANTFSEGKQGYKCFEHGLWHQHDFVCSTFLCSHTIKFVRNNRFSTLYSIVLVSLYIFSDMCSPPFPFPCHKDAQCKTTEQNYTCTCKPGFAGNGYSCTGTDHAVFQYELLTPLLYTILGLQLYLSMLQI